MGEFTVTKWQCDRCKAVFDVRPKRTNGSMGSSPTYYEVTASEDYGVAGGTVIDWKEMCHPCNKIVGEQLDAMRASISNQPEQRQ